MLNPPTPQDLLRCGAVASRWHCRSGDPRGYMCESVRAVMNVYPPGQMLPQMGGDAWGGAWGGARRCGAEGGGGRGFSSGRGPSGGGKRVGNKYYTHTTYVVHGTVCF